MHPLEKLASQLNTMLKTQAKAVSKAWKIEARILLKESFDLLGQTPPDDAALCLLEKRLNTHIVMANSPPVDLEKTPKTLGESAKIATTHADELRQTPDVKPDLHQDKRQDTLETQANLSTLKEEQEGEHKNAKSVKKNHHPEALRGNASTELAPAKDAETSLLGYFEMVHVGIRQFFKINACLPERVLARASANAERHSEVLAQRIEAFIAVLSKSTEIENPNTNLRSGYHEELLKDMPERGLVLHPKRKKKT